MDKISEPDGSVERHQFMAKMLEAQVGPCSSTMRLFAWLVSWIEGNDGLAAMERSPSTLPQELRSDYAAWIKMDE